MFSHGLFKRSMAAALYANRIRKACLSPYSAEQHAVDELLQLAVKGTDIDGQVLAYLELAQVCLAKNRPMPEDVAH
jgi:hypothetical protein